MHHGFDQDAQLRERLAELAAFAPILGAPGFVFAKDPDPTIGSDGVLRLHPPVLSDDARAFLHVVICRGWVLKDFDWPRWKNSPEAQALLHDVSQATALQLARLLTVMVRQDRFIDGALVDHFESGTLLHITLRAEALLKAFPNNEQGGYVGRGEA